MLLSLCVLRSGTIDIHVHDTYYVLSPYFFFLPPACFLFGIAGLYFFAGNQFRDSRLVWVHVLLTVVAIFLFTVIAIWLPMIGSPRSYSDLQKHSFTSFNWSRLMIITALLFVLAQGFFILNFIRSFGKAIPRS